MPRRRRASPRKRCVKSHDNNSFSNAWATGIESLPAEMVDVILSKLDDPCDQARCRMASRIFWTRDNRPENRYHASACPCSRHLRIPMPYSEYACEPVYPGHGFYCYPRAISDALARGLVDEADWLWRRYLSALCVPRPFQKAQRRLFPYTGAVDYTVRDAWSTAIAKGTLDAVKWAYDALLTAGLCPEPCRDYYDAILRGDKDLVVWMLNTGLIKDTWSAAYSGATGGHLDLVRALLDRPRHAAVYHVPCGGVWSGAAEKGHSAVAATLLDEFGLGYERVTRPAQSALSPGAPHQCSADNVKLAASAGAIDALAILWHKHGGGTHAKDAAIAAAKACRVDVLEWLISMGAHIDAADIASACSCRGHGARAASFDLWRRSRYGFAVSCAAIRCAFGHCDADAMAKMGAKRIRRHLEMRCRCSCDVDWRRLLTDLFYEYDNPNAPTSRNKAAVAGMANPDNEVSRIVRIIAHAAPRLCVSAKWLTVAVRAGNMKIVDALLPHADAHAAHDAVYEACKIGNQRLFAHLLALCQRRSYSVHVSLNDTNDPEMAAFLMDQGLVGTPTIYALGEAVTRGRAAVVKTILARMTKEISGLQSTCAVGCLPREYSMQLLRRAAEAGSAETIAALAASALGPLFGTEDYYEAIDTAARNGRLDLIDQLVSIMGTFFHKHDPLVVARASACARLTQQDDTVATSTPLSPEETRVMHYLADGKRVIMHTGYAVRLSTCTRIARLMRRWPYLATPSVVMQLISAGARGAWLEQFYTKYPQLFPGDQTKHLLSAALAEGAPDVVRWICRKFAIAPSVAARAALDAVSFCDVSSAQCLLTDGGGAEACDYANLVAAATTAEWHWTRCDKSKWGAYSGDTRDALEDVTAQRMNRVDQNHPWLVYGVTPTDKAQAWVKFWVETCWRPAAVGIEPTGACF